MRVTLDIVSNISSFAVFIGRCNEAQDGRTCKAEWGGSCLQTVERRATCFECSWTSRAVDRIACQRFVISCSRVSTSEQNPVRRSLSPSVLVL
jgi:hypothetical protein